METTTETPKASAEGKHLNTQKAKATAKQAHKEALAEPEFPRSLLTGFGEFPYKAMPLKDANRLHAVAIRIRGRASKSMIEDGRDFIRVKHLIPHGDWSTWLDREQISYNMKMAQRAMSVARMCEGRSKYLEGLPATCLYDLAAKSISDAVKDAVSAEADRLGRTPDPQWVWKQVSTATAERDAKKALKSQSAASDAVSEPVGETAETETIEAEDLEDIAKDNAVALIVGKLSADDARKLVEYADEAGWTDLADRLAHALREAA